MPLVYLDNAATSQKPVGHRHIDPLLRETHANVHRGVHTLSEEATAPYEGARAKVSNFIDATCPKEVIWTRNASEALNVVAYSWGRANLKRGDRVLLTEMEHHSNIVPWQILAAERGIELDFVRVADDGTLILDNLTKLSDATDEAVRLHLHVERRRHDQPGEGADAGGAQGRRAGVARRVPGRAAHAGGRARAGRRFPAFSGHKMLGPTGIGVLWGRRELLNAMPPFMGGGDMIREVHLRVQSRASCRGSSRPAPRPSRKLSASARPWII